MNGSQISLISCLVAQFIDQLPFLLELPAVFLEPDVAIP